MGSTRALGVDERVAAVLSAVVGGGDVRGARAIALRGDAPYLALGDEHRVHLVKLVLDGKAYLE